MVLGKDETAAGKNARPTRRQEALPRIIAEVLPGEVRRCASAKLRGDGVDEPKGGRDPCGQLSNSYPRLWKGASGSASPA
ncbi:MAG TPA: hypothetical protein QGH10_18220 [Armatimonadota bacterium]|nr:hypothetical protein [Armatimonadota bacterium]